MRGMTAGTRLKDQPRSDLPRERLAAFGARALGSADLMAILLRTGLKGRNVLEVARELLARFGSLHALAGASLVELRAVPGIGRDKAVTLLAAFDLARRMAEELHGEMPLLDTPGRVADYAREQLRLDQRGERLLVLLLNTRRRLIKCESGPSGSLDTVLVHARDVFRPAILAAAAAVVLVHNHPSGDPAPSEADIRVTRDLVRAGQLLKIEVVDHVILGRATEQRPKDYSSLREMGYFYT